jgi:hypothetical protein
MLASRQLAFRITGVWLGLAGLLMLVPAIHIQPVGLAAEYGGVLLGIALVAFTCAAQIHRLELLWLPFALGLALNALINLLCVLGGHYGVAAAGLSIVINSLLAAWFWWSRPVYAVRSSGASRSR